MIAKFIFDRALALVGVLILFPLWLLLPVAIVLDSRGRPFFVQKRVGKGGRVFGMVKFRTMRPGAQASGRLTVGRGDARITRIGRTLRQWKIDELPQLFNVLLGRMSFVGPRPEVPEYVALYTPRQRRVLEVRPGITDYASIHYLDENEILAKADDPQKAYVEQIMPHKLEMNLEYLDKRSFGEDLRVMWLTLRRLLVR